jgi:hypothetical protein
MVRLERLGGIGIANVPIGFNTTIDELHEVLSFNPNRQRRFTGFDIRSLNE